MVVVKRSGASDAHTPVSGADEPASPLSAEIARDLDALESAVASDTGDRGALRKQRRLVQRLRAAWRAGDGSIERLLEDPGIGMLRARHLGMAGLFDLLKIEASRQRAGRGARLERLIHSYCTETGQPFHGRYPRITVAHFVEVSVNEQSGRTKVGSISVQSLDWSKIRPALDKEIARVWKRPFEPPAFRDQLLAVYTRLAERLRNPTGFVRLSDIFMELRAERARQSAGTKSTGRLYAYYRDEFSADLSKLWGVQLSGELPGTQLEFTAIRQAEAGFSVILPNGSIGTYGFVRPKR